MKMDDINVRARIMHDCEAMLFFVVVEKIKTEIEIVKNRNTTTLNGSNFAHEKIIIMI